jgi:serine/threonine protein kinase
VHRDVKPGNLLLDAGGQTGRPDHVYLSDFGLSKDSFSPSNATAVTAIGQVLGTLDYMAPEQILGRRLDGRADQYGLACTAYELLCGRPPFGRQPRTALLRAHRSDTPPRLTSQRPDLPRRVDIIFARALAKSPSDRYGDCGEFAASLRTAFGLEPYRPGSRLAAPPHRSEATAAPSASPGPPLTPRGGQGYPAGAPTIRKARVVASANLEDAERTEIDEVRAAGPAAQIPAPGRPRRRWFQWNGRRRRGAGRTGGRSGA